MNMEHGELQYAPGTLQRCTQRRTWVYRKLARMKTYNNLRSVEQKTQRVAQEAKVLGKERNRTWHEGEDFDERERGTTALLTDIRPNSITASAKSTNLISLTRLTTNEFNIHNAPRWELQKLTKEFQLQLSYHYCQRRNAEMGLRPQRRPLF